MSTSSTRSSKYAMQYPTALKRTVSVSCTTSLLANRTGLSIFHATLATFALVAYVFKIDRLDICSNFIVALFRSRVCVFVDSDKNKQLLERVRDPPFIIIEIIHSTMSPETPFEFLIFLTKLRSKALLLGCDCQTSTASLYFPFS